MSSSQARLMSLTARLSDLEYSAQSVQNSKIRLADRSEASTREYQAALNQEKLTVYSPDTLNKIDATAYNLTTYNAISTMDRQRFLHDLEGRILVTAAVGASYDNSQNAGGESYNLKQLYPTANDYLVAILGYSNEPQALAAGLTYNQNQVTYYTNRYTGVEAFMNSSGYTSNPANVNPALTQDLGATVYYNNIFNQIAAHGYNSPGDAKMRDSEWLYEMLQNGQIFLSEWDSKGGAMGTGAFVDVSYNSGDVTLQTEKDDLKLAKAEADYELVQAEIQSQDKKFDLQLKQIETEHSAIQTEIDSVKKVINKNIERSFKVFNA